MQGGVRALKPFSVKPPCRQPGLGISGPGIPVEGRTGDSTHAPERTGMSSRRRTLTDKSDFQASSQRHFAPRSSVHAARQPLYLAVVVVPSKLPAAPSSSPNREAIGRLFCETRQDRGGPRGPQRNWLLDPCLFRFAGKLEFADWCEATLDPAGLSRRCAKVEVTAEYRGELLHRPFRPKAQSDFQRRQ
jgi:hypothetical protein